MLTFNRSWLSQRHLGLVLAFGSMMSLGSYSALAKSLTPYISPISLVIISELLTAVCIVVTFGIFPLLREVSTLSWKTAGIIVAFGLLSSVAVPLLWFIGLSQTTAVNASMLATAELVAVILLGYWLLGERISVMQEIGASVILGGIVIVNVWSMDVIGVFTGDVYILLATQLSGLSTVLFKKYLSHISPELTLVIRNVSAAVFIASISLFVGLQPLSEVPAFSLEAAVLLLAFVFFSRYLSLTMFYESLERLPMTTVGAIHIAEPLFGMLFGALLLHESIYSYHVVGAVLIISGLMLEQTSVHVWRTAGARIAQHAFWFGFRMKRKTVGVVV